MSSTGREPGHVIEVVAFGSPLYRQMLEVRDQHLRRPLGLTQTAADVAGEDQQIHIAAVEQGLVQATLCLKTVSPTRVKLRQMVVVPAKRGTGLGSEVVRYGEQLARDLGFTDAELHARLSALRFYERLGYRSFGDQFEEVSLPHIAMERHLTES